MSYPYVRISILSRRMKKRMLVLGGYRPRYEVPIYGMDPRHVTGGLLLKIKVSEPVILQAKSSHGERWGIAPVALQAGTHHVPLTLFRGQTQIMLVQLTFAEVALGFGFRGRLPASSPQPVSVDIRERHLWRLV